VPIYLGPSLSVSRTENSLHGGALPPEVSASELDETRFGLGVHIQRDSRDDTFYPKQGSLADFEFQFFETALGSDFAYRVWDVGYRRFDELWPEGILASRVFGRFSEGNVPFTDLSQHDLRGYERGRYRDRMQLGSEIELRQHLFGRFAGAAFAGLGQVAPAIDEFDGDRILWSAGFGLRFQLTEQNRMNYRSDIAWGRDGFEFYFSITEAF
jgi:outer membrane protein assembly factor BamA